MKVLSLFDGMAGCRLALEKVGITPVKYYAAEIDKFAIKETQANFPEHIHLGSVTEWREWDVDWSEIDLVTGGFPCQAWSMAGKQLGDKDERGMLFWTMLDIMKQVMRHNPKAKFLIENVKMKKEFEQYITTHTENALGHVHKILINASLVSAQNRQRYYWTNFEVTQPEDRGIVLGDILERGFVDRDKSHCLDANYFKGENPKSYFEKNRRQLAFGEGCKQVATATDIKGLESLKRVYSEFGKAPTLTTMQGGHRQPKVSISDSNEECLMNVHYRKLTVVECCRLQGVPDDFFKVSSNSQAYKMLGNGWQLDVIAHIFKGFALAVYEGNKNG